MLKRKQLSDRVCRQAGQVDYLGQIKSAIEKQEWAKAKQIGEAALKKLPNLSYSPYEKYLLYCRLSAAHNYLVEYSRSLDASYKAYLIASKHSLRPEHLAYASLMTGHNFSELFNFKQALYYLGKVEQYYQKYGNNTSPMDKLYGFTYIIMGNCWLHQNELVKVREVMEKLQEFYPSPSDKIDRNLINYHRFKAAYFIKIKQYGKARISLQECLKISEQTDFQHSILNVKIALASVDILDGNIDVSIHILKAVIKNASRLKINDLICEAAILLSKCYFLSDFPSRVVAIENKIRPILQKLDVAWLYEKTREFEQLFRQLIPPTLPTLRRGDKGGIPFPLIFLLIPLIRITKHLHINILSASQLRCRKYINL